MLIKLRDFERIYKTINTILLNENADTTAACMFFSVYGAYIISNHYKIDASPVAGLALYNLGEDDAVLGFGKIDDGHVYATSNEFHCWVEGNGWLFDFMSPNFPQLLSKIGKTGNISAKMMQKPLNEMSSSPTEFKKIGDFYLQPSHNIAQDVFSTFSENLAFADLAGICSQWFKKTPRKMQKSIIVGDNKGNQNKVNLQGNRLTGAW